MLVLYHNALKINKLNHACLEMISHVTVQSLVGIFIQYASLFSFKHAREVINGIL